MFDRSFLPAAQFEFVVIADTHYMIDPTGQQVEFTSRRRQTARAEHAFQLLAAMNGDAPQPLIIHMGDLIQEFPEQPAFAQARAEALAQIDRHGLVLRQVAGNHDVGDKPDPTMPASWVTPAFLADYHERFGPSWYSWDEGDLHFIVLNSQIMNSALPAAVTQEAWLADDLTQHGDKRILLFLHLPPYIYDPAEPHLGHYDNLGQPARGRLLDLLKPYSVERVFAAHIHWAFYNQLGTTRLQTVPSVAFTRPGFSELFSSAPPAEQGRDDVGKLGFFLVRVHDKESRVHFIRTGGKMEPATEEPVLVSGISGDLPHSPLGIIARHPIAPTGQVPSAWPSTIRQPVRNDYGFLSLLELGVRHLCVPITDLQDRVQRERLTYLQEQGVTITGQLLYESSQTLAASLVDLPKQCNDLEIALPGTPWPDVPLLNALSERRASAALPVGLSCVVPGHKVEGKQHSRFQIGYFPEQLVELNQRLAAADCPIDRVCCRLDGDITTMLKTLQSVPHLSHIGALDWRYTIPSGSEQEQRNAVATVLFALSQRAHDRLFLEPFVTLDRTMDSGPGLLDRAYNPTVLFPVVRHLNTLLYHQAPTPIGPVALMTAADHLQLTVTEKERLLSCVLPTGDSAVTVPPIQSAILEAIGLQTGTIRVASPVSRITITEPTLFYGKLSI